MKSTFRDKFDHAIRLKDQGDYAGAREVLLQLHRDDPASAAVLAILGHVCWESNHLNEAILFFQKAVDLKPSAEVVSLGLFHCLWESGRTDAAFDEMKRFLASYESNEYESLLSDINRS